MNLPWAVLRAIVIGFLFVIVNLFGGFMIAKVGAVEVEMMGITTASVSAGLLLFVAMLAQGLMKKPEA